MRDRLLALLDDVSPWDDQERADLAAASAWIGSGAPLYRTHPPDVPPMHLVSYFVVVDDVPSHEACRNGTQPAFSAELLLVAHRKAGLWLPTGGHVEPDEDPWETVRRECREELDIPANGDPQPLFLTIARTRGAGPHTDVSLWHVLRAAAETVVRYDEEEFAAIRWLTPDQILAEPLDTLDPHMHRFARKLTALL